RRPLGELARDAGEVSLAREAPQLPGASVPVDGGAYPLGLLDPREVGVALVDRLELERVLQPGEVEVVLLHLLGDESVGALAVDVELPFGRRGVRHGRRIPACRRSASGPTAAPS